MIGEVDRTCPVRVHDLGRDALREHVRGRHQTVGRGVAVDVDEAGRDEQPRRVDVDIGAGPGQIAYARN